MLHSAYYYRHTSSASSTANSDVSLLAEHTVWGQCVVLFTAVEVKAVCRPIVCEVKPMKKLKMKTKKDVVSGSLFACDTWRGSGLRGRALLMVTCYSLL